MCSDDSRDDYEGSEAELAWKGEEATYHEHDAFWDAPSADESAFATAEEDVEGIAMLVDMGFGRSTAVDTLVKCDGDVQKAADMLLMAELETDVEGLSLLVAMGFPSDAAKVCVAADVLRLASFPVACV